MRSPGRSPSSAHGRHCTSDRPGASRTQLTRQAVVLTSHGYWSEITKPRDQDMPPIAASRLRADPPSRNEGGNGCLCVVLAKFGVDPREGPSTLKECERQEEGTSRHVAENPAGPASPAGNSCCQRPPLWADPSDQQKAADPLLMPGHQPSSVTEALGRGETSDFLHGARRAPVQPWAVIQRRLVAHLCSGMLSASR